MDTSEVERHPKLEILLVEDDDDVASSLAEELGDEGHQITVVGDGDRAMRRLDERTYDLLICDVRLPGTDGLSIFHRVKREHPETPVILMSAYGSIPEAVNAVKADAATYLAKPFGLEQMLAAVREVEERVWLERRLATARKRAQSLDPDSVIVGQTPAIARLRERIRAVADADGPVLITGETGTGKELVARTIHALSRRCDRPFVAVNCAAFPDTLLEAELFGHERGAFTGATHRREGRFRIAEGGTLFLDEVGEMSPGAQAKLLRVLEDGTFQPLGSDVTIRADVRAIAATNVSLPTRIRTGAFREDLYYRLKLFNLHVPPLRERRPDLPLLVEHFCCALAEHEPPRLTPRAWAALSHYDYPGNVRELRHAILHAMALARDAPIDLHHLPDEIRGGVPEGEEAPGAIRPLAEAERAFERDYLLRTLRETGWNKTRAAQVLGISRKTLWKKLRQLGIDAPGAGAGRHHPS